MNTPAPEPIESSPGVPSTPSDQQPAGTLDVTDEAASLPSPDAPHSVIPTHDRSQPKADRTQQIITLIVLVLIVLSFALLVYSVATGAADTKGTTDIGWTPQHHRSGAAT